MSLLCETDPQSNSGLKIKVYLCTFVCGFVKKKKSIVQSLFNECIDSKINHSPSK